MIVNASLKIIQINGCQSNDHNYMDASLKIMNASLNIIQIDGCKYKHLAKYMHASSCKYKSLTDNA